MVKIRDVMLEYNVKNLKMQIRHHEKKGEGNIVMEQKAQLKKVERMKELNAIST